MKTWAGKGDFKYNGSVDSGTTITYGSKQSRVSVTADDYSLLRQSFLNQTVHIGTSRDNRPRGSLGQWLEQNVTRTAIASYVGPILIAEGYAKKVGDHKIRIIR